MFKCSVCKESIGPKVSPTRVVTGIRDVSYHNEYKVEDEYGNEHTRKVDSMGTEITGMQLVCQPCAGLEVPVKGVRALIGAHGFHEKPAEPLRVKLVACVIDTTLDKLNHNSARAKRDAETAVPLIKGFVDVNKDLVF